MLVSIIMMMKCLSFGEAGWSTHEWLTWHQMRKVERSRCSQKEMHSTLRARNQHNSQRKKSTQLLEEEINSILNWSRKEKNQFKSQLFNERNQLKSEILTEGSLLKTVHARALTTAFNCTTTMLWGSKKRTHVSFWFQYEREAEVDFRKQCSVLVCVQA